MTRFMSQHGYYEFNQFPGCSQLIVSNHAYIDKEHRGKGFGQKQQLQKLELAAQLGYNCIICTVRNDNNAEKAILSKNGWHYVWKFFNTETGHLIEIWVRDL